MDILTESLPAFPVGVSQNFKIQVIGGSAPYTFKITSGSLPAALSLSTDGTITGTVRALAPDTTIFVQVSDTAGAKVTQAYDVQVIEAPQTSMKSPPKKSQKSQKSQPKKRR